MATNALNKYGRDHYAYVHARPDYTIFYVGKGVRDRFLPSKQRNTHHRHIVKKYGASEILVGVIPCSSHEIALELEKGIIKCAKASGASLVNLTEGGDGVLGRAVSEATRQKLRNAFLGRSLRKTPISEAEKQAFVARNKARLASYVKRPKPPAFPQMEGMTRSQKISYRLLLIREDIRLRMMGDNNPMRIKGGHSEATKQAISIKLRGDKNPFFNKTHTAETKQKMRDIHAKRESVVCPHCFISGRPQGMLRWHFDHCKKKL